MKWWKSKKDKNKKCYECERLQKDVDFYKEFYESYLRILKEFQNQTELVVELLDICKVYEKQSQDAIEIFKFYARWDNFIMTYLKQLDPHMPDREGPATTLLKSIGEYHIKDQGKTYGH